MKYACEVSSNILYRIQTRQLLLYQFHGPISNESTSRKFLSASFRLSWHHTKILFTWLLLPSFSCWVLAANIHSCPLSGEWASYCLWNNLPPLPPSPCPHNTHATAANNILIWAYKRQYLLCGTILWCNCSRIPCRIWLNLDSKLEHFLAWLFTCRICFLYFLSSEGTSSINHLLKNPHLEQVSEMVLRKQTQHSWKQILNYFDLNLALNF